MLSSAEPDPGHGRKHLKSPKPKKRDARDVLFKLTTGAGKTLIGLLAAQSIVNETRGKVLYVCATNQLLEQTREKAREYGLTTAEYYGGSWTGEAFHRGEGPGLTNYHALLHGRSVFEREKLDVDFPRRSGCGGGTQRAPGTVPETTSTTPPMRIAFFEVSEAWERQYLERSLGTQEPSFFAEALTPETAERAGDAEAVSVFIRSSVDRSVLGLLPRVRLVATRSTGFDHIDLDACEERGVAVTNVPRYGESTVVEHTFGLILNLSRKIHQAFQRTRDCDFSLRGLEGIDLRGKTLGVIGAGGIGLHVIRIARAFGMEVLAHDVRPLPLLPEADVVTLHAPLLPETRHLSNRERFRLMRRGALLVNTARGPLVDTEALLWALDEGIVAGAGLDVLEGEEVLAEESHMFRTPESEVQLAQTLTGQRPGIRFTWSGRRRRLQVDVAEASASPGRLA